MTRITTKALGAVYKKIMAVEEEIGGLRRELRARGFAAPQVGGHDDYDYDIDSNAECLLAAEDELRFLSSARDAMRRRLATSVSLDAIV